MPDVRLPTKDFSLLVSNNSHAGFVIRRAGNWYFARRAGRSLNLLSEDQVQVLVERDGFRPVFFGLDFTPAPPASLDDDLDDLLADPWAPAPEQHSNRVNWQEVLNNMNTAPAYPTVNITPSDLNVTINPTTRIQSEGRIQSNHGRNRAVDVSAEARLTSYDEQLRAYQRYIANRPTVRIAGDSIEGS